MSSWPRASAPRDQGSITRDLIGSTVAQAHDVQFVLILNLAGQLVCFADETVNRRSFRTFRLFGGSDFRKAAH
jgi:hypothetical protein